MGGVGGYTCRGIAMANRSDLYRAQCLPWGREREPDMVYKQPRSGVVFHGAVAGSNGADSRYNALRLLHLSVSHRARG